MSRGDDDDEYLILSDEIIDTSEELLGGLL